MKHQLKEFCDYLTEKEVIIKTDNQDDIIEKFIKLHTETPTPPVLTDIIRIVSAETGTPVEQMKTKNRRREVVESRQIAMFFLHENTKLSLSAIGECFAHEGIPFDHSTVLYAIKTVKNLKETDKAYRLKFERIKTVIEKSKECN